MKQCHGWRFAGGYFSCYKRVVKSRTRESPRPKSDHLLQVVVVRTTNCATCWPAQFSIYDVIDLRCGTSNYCCSKQVCLYNAGDKCDYIKSTADRIFVQYTDKLSYSSHFCHGINNNTDQSITPTNYSNNYGPWRQKTPYLSVHPIRKPTNTTL